MNLTIFGIDLAKTSFSLVGTTQHGHAERDSMQSGNEEILQKVLRTG